MSNKVCDEIDIDYKAISEGNFSQFATDSIDSISNFFDLKYAYFYSNYMLSNLPCVIKNVSDGWKCTRDWIKDNAINYDYFTQEYGDYEAPVADCDNINFNAHCKHNMKVKEYITYLKDQHKQKLLYLKDWHLQRVTNNKFYEVPKIFASDWLNEYAVDNKDDDFMFVYIGPQNSWTPFHADVYLSYSWSVNVIGRKKWILLPPGEEEKMQDSFGSLPLLFDPNIHKNVKYFEVIQERGDAIFIPTGWHHQVFNLLDTISINHNFINACNIESVWEALQNNLLSVEKEIREFIGSPDFTSQCQLILKSVFGMDFESFIKFIIHIAHKRVNHLNGKQSSLFEMYNLQQNHVIFDLSKILTVINYIEKHPLLTKNLLSHNTSSELLNIKNIINIVIK